MSQILQPGGGVMLIPFVRLVVCLLLLLTVGAAVLDLARIHMVVLSVLSSGLLLSLSFFESEIKKQQGGGQHSSTSSATTTTRYSSLTGDNNNNNNNNKTD
jgi:ER protein Pkr1